MAHAVRRNPSASLLNTDHRPHPLQDTLLAATLVLGAIAIISSIFDSLHLLSSWTGLIGILTAAYGQFVSVTTRERFGLIVGLVASAVGFYIGMAHGGLFGGVLG
ncbi:hypothetical protein HUT18_16915 [Streptomyces sp. NA04227]|uniref:hypothetical protein n=1 Tax=Streptomyces sp. NA04227 TaxID=2742136 RepID=UPI00159052DA|nr:hypothetical protein [Streptomyces sp. NA04227]QKW07816.1 hypothetical protein HUT18_16915 [Streptomyces sp. NA04227]